MIEALLSNIYGFVNDRPREHPALVNVTTKPTQPVGGVGDVPTISRRRRAHHVLILAPRGGTVSNTIQELIELCHKMMV